MVAISHDRFNEIIDEANKPDSIIRAGWFIDRDIPAEGQYIREIPPKIEEAGGLSSFSDKDRKLIREISEKTNIQNLPDEEIKTIIQEYERQKDHKIEKKEGLIETIKKLAEITSGLTLEIPRITIQPTLAENSCYRHFQLDLKNYMPLPIGEDLISVNLKTGERSHLGKSEPIERNELIRDSVMAAILDRNELAETEENQALALDLAEQIVKHFQSYLKNEIDIANVWFHYKNQLLPIIFQQMEQHYTPPKQSYSISGNTYDIHPRKTKKEIVRKGHEPVDFQIPVEIKSRIRELVFNGFEKSLYTEVVFHSDSERRFAQILENAPLVKKWLKANDGEIRYIFYHKDDRYHPDFVVETYEKMLLCEIKRRIDLDTTPVQQKKHAAIEWCSSASQLASQHGKKTWHYLLIPHDEVQNNITLEALIAKYTAKN